MGKRVVGYFYPGVDTVGKDEIPISKKRMINSSIFYLAQDDYKHIQNHEIKNIYGQFESFESPKGDPFLSSRNGS